MTGISNETGDGTRTGGTRAGRLLGVLDLFTEQDPVWTVELIGSALDVAVSTAYRYVRELYEHGYLVPAADGGYMLGPRFIEFDRQIRIADPLLNVGPAVMQSLKDPAIGAQLLCSFYGTRVLCVHQERSDSRITMQMERGRPFPLFLGAPSKIILAHLPAHHLKNLFLAHTEEIRQAGLGTNWPEFRDNLKTIKQRGFYVGSEIERDLVGVAAPVFRAPDLVVASLCIVRFRAEAGTSELAAMSDFARRGAELISSRLQEVDQNGVVPRYRAIRPAR